MARWSSAARPTAQADPRNRLAELCELSRQRLDAHTHKGRIWKRLNYAVGGATALVTALAGVAILAEWWGKDVAGAIVVLGGVLTAMVSFYDFDGRTVAARLGRAEWRRLHQDALSLQSRAAEMQVGPLRDQVDALYLRCYELEKLDATSRVKS